jgi:hypothetical protein
MIWILIGLMIIGITIWDYRREEADFLFWFEYSWWDINRTDNPILFWIAIVAQILCAILCIAWGVTSHFFLQ